MALYACALIYMRNSGWRLAALTVGIVAWFAAVYEVFRFAFMK